MAIGGLRLPGAQITKLGSDQSKATGKATMGYSIVTSGAVDLIGDGQTKYNTLDKGWQDVLSQSLV